MAGLRALIVCTANVCRSPVVERLFDRQFRAHGLEAHVASAGTSGGNNVVHRNTTLAATEIGVDLSGHISRELTTELVNSDGRDLIVTMTRQHLYRVVELEPDAFNRTFTLRELALLGAAHGVDPLSNNFADWIDAVGAGRTTHDVTSAGDTYDVDDPYGGPRAAHRRMVDQVDLLVRCIVPILAASVDPATLRG